jgi:hypothetical protein
MLKDPRSGVGVGNFYRWWLHLEDLRSASKDPQQFPLFTRVVDSVIRDVVGFGVDLTLSDGHFAALMTAQRTYGDAAVGALVGDRGDEPRRAGLLGRPGLLALHARPERASPTKRGSFIRQDVLCEERLPPHPTGGDPPVPPQPAGMTNREHYASLIDPAPCKACHMLMDNIGYGLENFDAVGTFRSVDHGRMIDSSGALPVGDRTLSFNGVVELGKVLTGLREAQDCIVSKWYHYLRGMPAQPGDLLLARAQKIFFASSGDMREVIVVVLGAHPL